MTTQQSTMTGISENLTHGPNFPNDATAGSIIWEQKTTTSQFFARARFPHKVNDQEKRGQQSSGHTSKQT